MQIVVFNDSSVFSSSCRPNTKKMSFAVHKDSKVFVTFADSSKYEISGALHKLCIADARNKVKKDDYGPNWAPKDPLNEAPLELMRLYRQCLTQNRATIIQPKAKEYPLDNPQIVTVESIRSLTFAKIQKS